MEGISVLFRFFFGFYGTIDSNYKLMEIQQIPSQNSTDVTKRVIRLLNCEFSVSQRATYIVLGFTQSVDIYFMLCHVSTIFG